MELRLLLVPHVCVLCGSVFVDFFSFFFSLNWNKPQHDCHFNSFYLLVAKSLLWRRLGTYEKMTDNGLDLPIHI